MNKFDKKIKNKQGFTLLEVVVTIGLFMILMAGSTTVFASIFRSYKVARNANENLKNSQQAMNLITKTIRTSTVISSSPAQIVIYDFSRGALPECIRYSFNGGKLYESKVNVAAATSDQGITNCAAVTNTAFDTNDLLMSTGTVFGRFEVYNSMEDNVANKSIRVGRVTIMMNVAIGLGASEQSRARIQSTTSLRDYSRSGVGIDINNPL